VQGHLKHLIIFLAVRINESFFIDLRDSMLHGNQPERAKKLAFGFVAPHHYMDDLVSMLYYHRLRGLT
jgi:hypothetical protein